MGLGYGLGSATTALAVVGACKIEDGFSSRDANTRQICSSLATAKLSMYVRCPEAGRGKHANHMRRLGSSSKMYRHTHGQTWALDCA